MTDIVSRKTRSWMMSGIRGKNTNPELQVRHALFAKGFRYRLHSSALPGRPDIVLSKYRAVVFINGCFWHCHGCKLFKWPQSNTKFWKRKLSHNRKADEISRKKLEELGWRVAIVWECTLKGTGALKLDNVANKMAKWIRSSNTALVVKGKLSTPV